MSDAPYSFQGWIADLSDGTTMFEVPPIPGEPTPWQHFLMDLKRNPTFMTDANPPEERPRFISHLRLQRHNVTIHCMPPKMCDGYFHAYEVEQLVYRNILVYKQGIGCVKDGIVYITWVSRDVNPEIGMVYQWQEIRPLDSCIVHTTLSEVTDVPT